MESVNPLVVICVVFGVMYLVTRMLPDKKTVTEEKAIESGHLLHLRSGDYPAWCSWCQNTTLAKKLITYERADGTWRANDVGSALVSCASDDVARLSSVFKQDQPLWRRFCSEKCTKEFLAVENVGRVENFVSCAYCSSRSPDTFLRCPTCGAGRAS